MPTPEERLAGCGWRHATKAFRRAACVCMLTFPATAWLASAPAALQAQSVEREIRSLVGANAEGYLRPVSDGMSFALTGGIFDSARPRGPLSFDIGIRILGALPKEGAREFTASLPDTVRWQPPQGGPEQVFTDPFQAAEGSLRTPTVVGEGPGIVLEPTGSFRDALLQAGEDPDQFRIFFPEGLDLRAVPTAMLSASVGVGLGTEISARFLPKVRINSEIGRVGAHGWGIQHSVSQWFSFPLDLSIGIGRQDLEISDLIEATASEGWFLVGRTLGPLTVFGSAGVRNASVDVAYEVDNPDGIPGIPDDGTPVRFSSNLDSTTALGAGFRLQLLLMNLSGQYTSGDFNTFSVKVGLGTP